MYPNEATHLPTLRHPPTPSQDQDLSALALWPTVWLKALQGTSLCRAAAGWWQVTSPDWSHQEEGLQAPPCQVWDRWASRKSWEEGGKDEEVATSPLPVCMASSLPRSSRSRSYSLFTFVTPKLRTGLFSRPSKTPSGWMPCLSKGRMHV